MIHIIITSFNEPKATLRAVRAFLNQKTKQDFKIIVSDPFPETGRFLKKNVKDKRVIFFLDPGEGKSYALNLIFQEYGSENKDDLFVLTDGDVYVGKGSLNAITEAFEDKKIGCVTGRPISLDTTSRKYGFWAKIAFEGIDRIRRKLSDENKFFECSGYLFTIRKGVIFDFPLETSEDSIIPWLFWKRGYGIKYVPEAEVYVKNPDNWKDFVRQKVRNIKAHENLGKIAPDIQRTKSFINEIRYGALFAISSPRSLREFLWVIELFEARLKIYLKAFFELKSRGYSDGWRGQGETESTKTLD